MSTFGPAFDVELGPAFDMELDAPRIYKQMEEIRELMLDGQWRSLREIEEITGHPPASISAQLRHLRKSRFGGYVVEKRRRGAEKRGLWEYTVSKKN